MSEIIKSCKNCGEKLNSEELKDKVTLCSICNPTEFEGREEAVVLSRIRLKKSKLDTELEQTDELEKRVKAIYSAQLSCEAEEIIVSDLKFIVLLERYCNGEIESSELVKDVYGLLTKTQMKVLEQAKIARMTKIEIENQNV